MKTGGWGSLQEKIGEGIELGISGWGGGGFELGIHF